MPWGEIVTGVFAVVVLVLGARINHKVNGVRKDAAATREQVVNGHEMNMREEGDERHQQNLELLEGIRDDVKRLRQSVGRLWERSDRHTDQIHELELTGPRSRFEPPRAPLHRKEDQQ